MKAKEESNSLKAGEISGLSTEPLSILYGDAALVMF